MKYRFSIEPRPAVRLNQRFNSKKRHVRRYFDFKRSMKVLALEQNFDLPDSFMITFIMPVPKSVSKKERLERLGKPHRQVPDIDNLLKAFMDALKKNDSYVHTVTAKKIWGNNGAIEVII